MDNSNKNTLVIKEDGDGYAVYRTNWKGQPVWHIYADEMPELSRTKRGLRTVYTISYTKYSDSLKRGLIATIKRPWHYLYVQDDGVSISTDNLNVMVISMSRRKAEKEGKTDEL